MQRLRLSDVRATVARMAQLNTDDARVADYVNRAQERLLYTGKWVGTYGRYRVCINSDCITLPRELETIETAAICKRPATVRGEWYEFISAGPGIIETDNCLADTLIDRGESCCYDDPVGTNNKLAIWCDRKETTTDPVNLQFYDPSGLWVRSSWAGEFIDGENLTLPAPGVFQVTNKMVATNGLVRASKPITNGTVRVFQYNLDTTLYRPLAIYAPDETVPVYRRYYVPNTQTQGTDSDTDTCARVTLDIMGKFRFIPARTDRDYLMVSQPEAIRLMVQAVKKEEDNLFNEARAYEVEALTVLDRQLKHYKGDGEVQPIQMLGNEITGPGVMNLI